MLIKELNTSLSPFEIFQLFKDEKDSIFLDSSDKYKKLGKYSIIAFNPFLKIKSKNGDIEILENNKKEERYANPFNILKKYLNKFKKDYKTDLPFIGGAIGYFSYDLCHHIEKLPKSAVDDIKIPDMFLCFYYGAIIFEHKTRKVFLTDSEIDNNGLKRLEKIKEQINNSVTKKLEITEFKDKISIKANMTKEKYIDSIRKIKNYIENGDIYQVNMTQRFETDLRENPIELYSKLRNINPAPFSAFLNYNDFQILSSSPERFIELRENKLSTRPIKGTRPRGKNKIEDKKLKLELKNSNKDKAELLMIVDLERNDFSKVSKTGTVKVPEFFVIEKYPTVYHLVSTVICDLDEKFSNIDVIEATFPGGSITGAPKIRAMQIIDELEPTTRNIYTGSIGYIDFNGNMDLNIVIRTMVVKDKKVYFQVGGGIVWDSDAYDEYQESLDKAKALIEALSL